MMEPRNRCGALGNWRLDGDAFRPKLDRRMALGSALAASAAMLLGSRPAVAWTEQAVSPAVLGAIPERRGVLPWRTLALTEKEYGRKPKFPAAVQQLDGREVVVEGHMLALDDAPRLRQFLLTAYKAHCPFCMPGGMVSMIAVTTQAAIPVKDAPLTLRGTLRVGAEPGTNLVYRLEKARIA